VFDNIRAAITEAAGPCCLPHARSLTETAMRTTSFRTALIAAGLAIATAAGGLTGMSRSESTTVHAAEDRGCSVATLSGRYGYTISGTIFLGPDGNRRADGRPEPVTAVGVVALDERGRLSGAETMSLHRRAERRTHMGAYEVRPDCTGTASLYFVAGPSVEEFAFVIMDGGRTFVATTIDPGSKILLTGTKQ
jgi:hypothetical protein